jgi:hypothetical protein
MDTVLGRSLADALARSSTPVDHNAMLGKECVAPLNALKDATDMRDAVVALYELDTILSAPSTPAQKATKQTLAIVKQHLMALLDSKTSDAAFAAEWMPISLAIMNKLVPMQIHGELMLIYMRLMAARCKFDDTATQIGTQVAQALVMANAFCGIAATLGCDAGE